MLSFTWMWWNQECRLCFAALCDWFMFGCTFTCKTVCVLDSTPQCIRFECYFEQRIWAALKLWQMKTQIKIYWTVWEISSMRVFFKDINVVSLRASAVFPSRGTAWGDLTGKWMAMGSSCDDLIHRSSGDELVSPSSVSWLIPGFLDGLRATGNMECIPD